MRTRDGWCVGQLGWLQWPFQASTGRECRLGLRQASSIHFIANNRTTCGCYTQGSHGSVEDTQHK